MPRYEIPDRWMQYKSVGKRIGETPFVALKCPLDERFFKDVPSSEHFCPSNIKTLLPEIALIIDLTNTTKYYNKKSIEDTEIEYKKIFCKGHIIPASHLINRFFNVVDKFLSENNDPDKLKLIGVHCTHGVNRTGFFICCYMINKLGYNFQSAIAEFNLARGHNIERQSYIDQLRTYELNPLSFVSHTNDETSEEKFVPKRNSRSLRRNNRRPNSELCNYQTKLAKTPVSKPRYINRLENFQLFSNTPLTNVHRLRRPPWLSTFEGHVQFPNGGYPHNIIRAASHPYSSTNRFEQNHFYARFNTHSENRRIPPWLNTRF